MPKKKYKYDVAISFAGENRKIAEDLVASIKAKDKRLSVFYDKDHKAHLWGKNTNEFDNIYGPESRYVIPIISEHYTKKDWPRYEFSTAVKESKKRKGDFILPIRVDDTRLIGLHDDLNYMDIREDDVDQIAKAVILKCQSISKASPKKSGSKSPVLRGSSREALGIIATCIFPTELINFKKIFPHVKWDKELGLLSRKGLILRSSQSIKITQNVKNIFINDPRDSKEFNLAWIKALEPLKQYPDLSLMLAIHYMHLEKLDQAIVLAADMVVGMDYSWLNDIYLAFFRGLIQKGHSIKIEIETRLKLYNSIGLCLCHTGKYLEAAKWFLKLRRYSQEKKNKWGTGQSYINCGVAYQKSGDFKKAKYCYTQAIKHARACKDDLLLSHSLNNLAYLTSTDAYQQAEKLIAESISIKTRIKDYPGLLASYGTLGYLAANANKLKNAKQWFLKLQKKANALGFSYQESMSLFNLGNVYSELGKIDVAISYYRQSYNIAKKYNYHDIVYMSFECKAKIYFEKGWFRKSELSFKKLRDTAIAQENDELILKALDGIGASLMKQKKFGEARKILQKAIKLAYRLADLEMITKLSVYKALTYNKGDLGKAAIKVIERDANNAQKSKKHLVALNLWIRYIAQLMDMNIDGNHIEMALNNALECINEIPDNYENKITLYAYFFTWQWQKKEFKASIKTLETIEKTAIKGQLWEDQAKAIDQKGVCLQELGKLDGAEQLHKKSLRLARRVNSNYCIQTSLNNLGEIYRKTERYTKAIEAYEEAEQIANQIKDYESEISTAHNRALALEDNGDCKEANQLLINCRDRSKRLHFWREYVRSWEALGNFAWNNENVTLASKRFLKALLEAKKYQLYELQTKIALNLARTLSFQRKYKEGLDILRPYEETFVQIIDSYVYYGTLAELYEKTNKLDLAEKNYILAKESASSIDNKDSLAYFCSALSELYRKQEQPNLSDAELKEAIRNEKNPEGLAQLLLQRFELLLDHKNEKIAEQLFQEATMLMKKHNLSALYMDIHMILGDYNWDGNYKLKFNAMQAYTVALMECFSYDMDSSSEIGSHIMTKLLWESGKSVELIDKLEKDITQWLIKENEATLSVVKCVLWPLRVARKMHPYRLKSKQLAKATNRIIKEETLALNQIS